MSRSFRILFFSAIALIVAVTESAAGDEDSRAKAVAAAIAACDKGASVPLDPTAKAPPVTFVELLPVDFDAAGLKLLQRQCQQAWVAAPQQKRLELQWLRVTVALGGKGQIWLVPQVQKLAADGSAEAKYLLFQIYRNFRREADGSTFPMSQEAVIASLTDAAERGHISALEQLMWQYRNGPYVKRDPVRAVQMARRIESAPPQGSIETPVIAQIKERIPAIIATITLQENGFSDSDQQLAFKFAEKLAMSDVDKSRPISLTYIEALRLGRGTSKDPARARSLLEKRIDADVYAIPLYADMLARGEGGPADVKRAFGLLADQRLAYVADAARVLSGLALDGKVAGKQPRLAAQALARAIDIDNSIRLAGLLVDYPVRVEFKDNFLQTLTNAARVGEPGAAMVLARLKLSGNSDFADADGGRALLKPLAESGDRAALWAFASSQYANLDTTSSAPWRRDGGVTDQELRSLIDRGIKNREAEAYLLAAKLLRRGVLYPQDDQAATNALISAANLGNVEAMVLLGDAYADGLGTEKNARERLKAWRLAAKQGSLAARDRLADAFRFDSFDKLMTLDEGVTGRLVLYINGYGGHSDGVGLGADATAAVEIGSLFSFGGRAMEAGPAAVANAVMNAFREAPAGLEDGMLVGIGKALPDEIRIAIENKLKGEGFYQGETRGYWGPEARQALGAWVYAKGPADLQVVAPVPSVETLAKDQGTAVVAPDVLDRVRDRAFKEAMAAKTDREKLTALAALNALARYGDMAPRWALLRNYHQAQVVRKAVTPGEITRYGLDILVARPEGMDKAEFEFIFVVSQLYQDGKIGEFADALLAAIRDDTRLQDPLTLGGIMQQVYFAPGACDAVLEAAKAAKVRNLGPEGCDERSRDALIGFAKASGGAGVDTAAREAAAREIGAMDAESAK